MLVNLNGDEVSMVVKVMFYHSVCMQRGGKKADKEVHLIDKLMKYRKGSLEIPRFVSSSSFVK